MSANGENLLLAVFNPDQLKRFCSLFEIEESRLECILLGWHKYVILSQESAFAFPRDPSFQANIIFEHELNRIFHSIPELKSLPIPNQSKLHFNGFINFYKFRQFSKIQGNRFDDILPQLSFQSINSILLKLVENFAKWHEYSSLNPDLFLNLLRKLPKNSNKPDAKQKSVIFQLESQMDVNHWANAFLKPVKYRDAYAELINYIKNFIKNFNEIPDFSIILNNLLLIEEKALDSLSKLHLIKPVLVHGDIHEDQFFVEKKNHYEITGIIDWESAHFAHPLWEFNFFEWGYGIWKYDNEDLQLFHLLENMWQLYIKKRNIEEKSVIGIQIFYLLLRILYFLKDIQESQQIGRKEDLTHQKMQHRSQQIVLHFKKITQLLTLVSIGKE